MTDLGDLLTPAGVVPLLTLAELPPAPACEACGCCRADLCAAALTEGTACVLMAAPPAERATTERVLRCPCAPVACTCAPPMHFRGIARCQHGKRARQAATEGAGT